MSRYSFLSAPSQLDSTGEVPSFADESSEVPILEPDWDPAYWGVPEEDREALAAVLARLVRLQCDGAAVEEPVRIQGCPATYRKAGSLLAGWHISDGG